MAAQLYLKPKGLCRGPADTQKPHLPSQQVSCCKHSDSCSALLSVLNQSHSVPQSHDILFQLNIQTFLITFKWSLRQVSQDHRVLCSPDWTQVWSTEGKKWSRLCLMFFSPQECKWVCFQPSIKHLYVPLPQGVDKTNPWLKARRKWAWQARCDPGTLSWFALCRAMIAKTIPYTPEQTPQGCFSTYNQIRQCVVLCLMKLIAVHKSVRSKCHFWKFKAAIDLTGKSITELQWGSGKRMMENSKIENIYIYIYIF